MELGGSQSPGEDELSARHSWHRDVARLWHPAGALLCSPCCMDLFPSSLGSVQLGGSVHPPNLHGHVSISLWEALLAAESQSWCCPIWHWETGVPGAFNLCKHCEDWREIQGKEGKG